MVTSRAVLVLRYETEMGWDGMVGYAAPSKSPSSLFFFLVGYRVIRASGSRPGGEKGDIGMYQHPP